MDENWPLHMMLNENYWCQMWTYCNWYCSWVASIRTNWKLRLPPPPPNNIVDCNRGRYHLQQLMTTPDDGNVGNLNANTSMQNCPDKMVAAAVVAVVVCNPYTLSLLTNDIVVAFFVYF